MCACGFVYLPQHPVGCCSPSEHPPPPSHQNPSPSMQWQPAVTKCCVGHGKDLKQITTTLYFKFHRAWLQVKHSSVNSVITSLSFFFEQQDSHVHQVEVFLNQKFEEGKFLSMSYSKLDHLPLSLAWTLFSCESSWRSLWARPAGCSPPYSTGWRGCGGVWSPTPRCSVWQPPRLQLLRRNPDWVSAHRRRGRLRARWATPSPGSLTCCQEKRRRDEQSY